MTGKGKISPVLWLLLGVAVLALLGEYAVPRLRFGRTPRMEPPTLPENAYPVLRRGEEGAIRHASGVVSAKEWTRWYPARATETRGPRWELQGRVTGTPGGPAPGRVTLRAELLGVEGGQPKPMAMLLRTEADGQFAFRELPPAKGIRLTVPEGGDWNLAQQEVEVSREIAARPLELPLYPAGRLTATVRRADGLPLQAWIAGARRAGRRYDRYILPSIPVLAQRAPLSVTDSVTAPVEFRWMQPGPWELLVVVPGYGRWESTMLLEPGENLDLGEIVVHGGYDFRVQLESDGSDQWEVSLGLLHGERLEVQDPYRRKFLMEGQALADERVGVIRSGKDLEFSRLHGGVYLLRLICDGIEYDARKVSIPEEDSVRLRTTPLHELSGVVEDERGRPIANALVAVQSASFYGSYKRSMLADPTGRFSIQLPEGPWRISARPNQIATYPRDARWLDLRESVENLVLRMEPVTEFSGELSRPLAVDSDMALRLVWSDGASAQRRITVEADQDTRFRQALPLAEFELFEGLNYHGRVSATAGVPVQRRFAQETADIRLRQEDGAGRFIGDGWAVLLPADLEESVLEAVPLRVASAGADGLLRFEKTVPGNYEIITGAAGFLRTMVRVRVLGTGLIEERVTLSQGTAALSIRVTDEESRRPLEGVLIHRLRRNDAWYPTALLRTDHHGVAELRDVSPGDFELWVRPMDEENSLTPKLVQVRGLAAGELREVEVSLVPGRRMRIRVVDEQGRGLVNARLQWHTEASADSPAASAVAWLNGSSARVSDHGDHAPVVLPPGYWYAVTVHPINGGAPFAASRFHDGPNNDQWIIMPTDSDGMPTPPRLGIVVPDGDEKVLSLRER